jgi:hypothetical protein
MWNTSEPSAVADVVGEQLTRLSVPLVVRSAVRLVAKSVSSLLATNICPLRNVKGLLFVIVNLHVVSLVMSPWAFRNRTLLGFGRSTCSLLDVDVE